MGVLRHCYGVRWSTQVAIASTLGAVLLAYSLLSGGEREKRVSLETAIPEYWLLWELPSGVACGEFARLL